MWVYITSTYHNIIINDSKYLLMYQEIDSDEEDLESDEEDLESDDNNEINEHEAEDNNMKTK